uniref:Zinc finger protein 277 n=1 Tax=Eptatretus burgeri TaxID=7764 RepID=A0A8C4R1P3_EPTBU
MNGDSLITRMQCRTSCGSVHAGGTALIDGLLEPLNLPERAPAQEYSPAELPCLLCSEQVAPQDMQGLLHHMVLTHSLLIADVGLVADFPRWTDEPLHDFKILAVMAYTEEQERLWLLCNTLPEDRQLRERLQQQRLEEVLQQQQWERQDITFSRECFFCTEHFTGNRSLLLNHMAQEHAFSVGLPDNIVSCTQLLDLLQSKLDNFQCLYCEKMFKDKSTLNSHMRKKQHRRINPRNKDYDKFYIINYLELGKKWKDVLSEDDRGTKDEDVHKFDLPRLRQELGLSFYQQVKLVNFIRREVYCRRCYACGSSFPNRNELVTHMTSSGHLGSPPLCKDWDQPQYYFPTYENDTLLYGLSDSEDESPSATRTNGVPVIAEDIPNPAALRQQSVLKNLLKSSS